MPWFSIVGQAQRIADGIRRSSHRDTWDSTRAIARQRDPVLADCNDVLHSDHVNAEPVRRMPHDIGDLVTGLL